jgi:hypothetical protein
MAVAWNHHVFVEFMSMSIDILALLSQQSQVQLGGLVKSEFIPVNSSRTHCVQLQEC